MSKNNPSTESGVPKQQPNQQAHFSAVGLKLSDIIHYESVLDHIELPLCLY